MQTHNRLLAALLLVGVASSQMWLAMRLPPHLVDRCDRPNRPIQSAEIAMVGVIRDDRLVVRGIPMHARPEVPLQLRKLTIRVENVLLGNIPESSVEVFYFTWAGGFDGNQPLGSWDVGARRIFLLRRESGVLRTACDGADNCTLGVFSGAHPQYRPDPTKPIGFGIADILLTRGQGEIRESRFAGAIEREAPAPFDYLIQKLGNLAVTEHRGVKTEACIGLWIYAQDPSSGELRAAAEGWMQAANCVCDRRANGSPNCGPEDDIDTDPPF